MERPFMFRNSLLVGTVLLAGMAAAQFRAPRFFNGGFPSMRTRTPSAEIRARATLQPSRLMTGQPGHILIELETGRDENLEQVSLEGLPEGRPGEIVYGSAENLPDAPAGTNDTRVVRRFRIPVRINVPRHERVNLAMRGMLTTRQQIGSMSSSFSHNVGVRFQPFEIDVKPLPTQGRPADFSGAVGTGFRLVARLAPDRVHPGDLITATYDLAFRGYCPSNLVPRVTGLEGFRHYDLKPQDIGREDVRRWTQMLVPQSTAPSNTLHVSIDWFDTEAQAYKSLTTAPAPLTFISAEAASTVNTTVRVDTHDAQPTALPTNAVTTTITLRFAPQAKSPVVATLPPGTPVVERARHNGWRRLEAPSALGWTR